jgi:hypothetical protein
MAGVYACLYFSPGSRGARSRVAHQRFKPSGERSLGATEGLVIGYVVTNLIWHVVAAFVIGLAVGWITAGPADD